MAQGDGDLNIRINTTSDGRGIDQAKKQVQDLKKEVNTLGQAYKEAGGGVRGIAAAGKQAAELYNGAGGGLKGVFSVLAGGGAKAAAAIGGLTTALVGAKKALLEFAGAERAVRGMQAALAQNGFLTSEVNQRYQELAQTLQEVTGRADDEWIDVLKRLTQFGATPQDIDRHVAAVKNLAGIMEGDLSGAAAAVAKAMQGEFYSFSRLGIQIDEHASQVEKLNSLYEQLAQRGGGQLEAQAESLTGQFGKFKNSLSDFFEAIGQGISSTGIVQTTLYGLGTTLAWLAGKMGGVIPAADGMTNALKKNIDTTIDAERFNKQYAESLKETARNAEAVAAAIDHQLESQRELRRIQDEQTDAQMALDLAMVDRMEKAGILSPEAAISRRGGIRSRAAGEKHKREQAGRVEEENAHRRKIEALMLQVEEENTEAEFRESEVVSEDEVNKRRAALKAKLDAEVAHWERNYAALIADPTSFSNPELGEKAGPRWGKGLHDLGARITQRVLAARAARESGLSEFDSVNRGKVEGSRERARLARERATLTGSKAAPQITDLTVEAERIAAEREAADTRFRTTIKADAVRAGTDAMGANSGVNTKAIEAEVIRSSTAFQGVVDNLGSTIVRRFETDAQALQDLARRLKLLEQREKHARNR
jgi:DNA-directed RNA polymerase subunit L